MRKIFANKLIIILSAIVLMVATTAVSFAYWKSGMVGDGESNNLTIHIGEGKALTSTVTLSAINSTSGQLIPHTRAAEAGETTKITVSYDVFWKADAEEVEKLDDAQEIGKLSVSCISIKIVGNDEAELLNVKGAGGIDPLFIISPLTYLENITINSVTATEITFEIQLNEPTNKAQYDLIAGQNIEFTFQFTVVSYDDSLQPV